MKFAATSAITQAGAKLNATRELTAPSPKRSHTKLIADNACNSVSALSLPYAAKDKADTELQALSAINFVWDRLGLGAVNSRVAFNFAPA